jgi:hypothetical protein
VHQKRLFQSLTCTELIKMAEHELAAFIRAVTELYGAEHGRLSAKVWLDELESMNSLPQPAGHDWRTVTVAALTRLASHLTATKVSAIPSCNVHVHSSGVIAHRRTL